jgi:hypothetical protein
LETPRQFQINFFGFSALDVNSRLQSAFDFVGKGQQRKRHGKPQHRQPKSVANRTRADLQAWLELNGGLGHWYALSQKTSLLLKISGDGLARAVS